jgi:hypothetical protein
MHTLILPLIGLPVAIGLFYFFKDLKKVKSWSVEPDFLAQPTINALDSVAYVDLPHVDGAAIEAIESGVETIETGIETGAEGVSEGIGQILETAGHVAGHLLHH